MEYISFYNHNVANIVILTEFSVFVLTWHLKTVSCPVAQVLSLYVNFLMAFVSDVLSMVETQTGQK